PAAQLGRAMARARPPRPQPALTSIEECRALIAACEYARARVSVLLASRFLALTAVRLEAVRGMHWSEIEPDEDREGLQGRWIWRVPPARMKLARAKKQDSRFAHLVPLSAEAVAVLRAAANSYPGDANLHSLPANLHALVFPGRDGVTPIGEGAIGALYARAGFAGRHVPHGWRSSFSTILNESMPPEWRADIDRALAHSPKDKVEAAYNRAAQLGRRRQLFDRWGALLAG
ncbi:tyrosine-type recombinase/integrase, partial [Novosphingobium album (ex Liu et al. 2023)]